MNTTSKQLTASIVPDISLMKKMASINGTILSRIMELVDNSIDAKITNQLLKIDIQIHKKDDQQYITIIDNGKGMNQEQAARFFRLGDSAKKDGKQIGRFGIGAKVAILGLGNKAIIKTSPLNENYGVEIDFDIEAFQNWEIDYKTKKERKDKHGTSIKIEDITVRLGDITKLETRLSEQIGKTYKHFIQDGDVQVKINGKKVKPTDVELLEDYYQTFDFMIGNRRVYGWAGAMKKAGTNWKFGFDLISNKRIIKANDFLSRQAHTSLARLTGEIFLDDFETDVHKTDFLRDKEEFQEMQQRLIEEELDELLTKVTKLTNKEVYTKYEDKVSYLSNILNRVISNYDFFQNIELNEEIFGFIKKEKRTKNTEKTHKLAFEAAPAKKEESKRKQSKPKEKQIGFMIEQPVFVSMGKEAGSKSWKTETKENGLHLQIEINMDHAMYQEEAEAETFIKNAIIDSIAEFIVKEEGKHESVYEDQIQRLNTIKDTLVQYSFQK